MFSKMKSNMFRICGTLILLISFFFLRVSFLEKFTFISTDHSIVSQSAIQLISHLKIMGILLGVFLFFFPQCYSPVHQIISRFFVRVKQRMSQPAIYLTLFLVVLFIGYLAFTFMGSLAFTHSQGLPGATGGGLIFLESYKTGLYYYHSLTSLLFIPAIDIEKIDIPIYRLYIKQEKLDTLNKDLHAIRSPLPESGRVFVPGHLIFENETLQR